MSLMERKRQIVYMGKSKRTKHAHEAPAPEDIVVDEGGPRIDYQMVHFAFQVVDSVEPFAMWNESGKASPAYSDERA